MLSIEDPPERPVCSMHGPLKWGYFTDTRQGPRWVGFTFEAGGVLVPHVCDNPDPAPIRWSPSEVVAARARAGADLARRVLSGDNPFIEEENNK